VETLKGMMHVAQGKVKAALTGSKKRKAHAAKTSQDHPVHSEEPHQGHQGRQVRQGRQTRRKTATN
jgi:hypothetical protein